MPWVGYSPVRRQRRSFGGARRAVRENCKRSGSNPDRAAHGPKAKARAIRHESADLLRLFCKTNREKRRAGATRRWMAATPHREQSDRPGRGADAFAKRTQIRRMLQRLRTEKADHLLALDGQIAIQYSKSKTSCLSPSVLSDGMWHPVPFNGPLSCCGRTRGMYRSQGIAAGYGAGVRRLDPR